MHVERKKMSKIIQVCCLLLAISIFSCNTGLDRSAQPEPLDDGSNATIQMNILSRTGSENTVTLAIDYRRLPSSVGPRLMELYLRHSESLEFVEEKIGQAIAGAQKELLIQKKGKGLLRVMAFSPHNLNTIESGRLVSLEFAHSGSSTAHFEILVDKPIFAPAGANQGLIVSDPLIVGLD